MQVRCPHCNNLIDFVDESSWEDIDCPSCGSSFNMLRDTSTMIHKPDETERIAHSSPPVEPNRQRSRHRPVSFGEFEVHQRTFNALSKLSTISLFPIATGKYQKRQGRCRYTSFSHPDAVIRRRVSALSQLSDRHAKCFIDLPAWFGTPAPRTPHHDRVVHNAKRAVFKIHYQAAA